MDNDSEICEWKASDGYCIKYRYYRAKNIRKGIIVSLHGIQSHSGWYDWSSRFLSNAGYDLFFLDRRGSGLNSSQRGHAASAERLIQDVVQFLYDCNNEADFKNQNIPLYLSGLSWGGKLAAVVAGRSQELIDGLILLYPGICAKVCPNFVQKMLLNLAKGDRFQFRKADIPLDDSALFTQDENWQKWIEKDYMSLREATVSFFRSSLELDQLSQLALPNLKKPMLMMLASQDRIIDNNKTREYFQQINTSDKKLIEYPDAAHTLEFEANREAIFNDLLNWLDNTEAL
jgi:alpha-beta hydrolase superfamily lysophospholipase